MKVKLTKNLSGRYVGKIGDIIDVEPHHVDAIIRQDAGTVLKEPAEPKKKEEKKEPA